MPATSEDNLRELNDREQIRETVHRYCWALDRGTIEDLMELFDDPCDLVLGPERYTGKAAVREWYDIYIQYRMEVLRHLIHNQIITIDGDTATSKSYFDAVGDMKGESIVAAGFYEDTLRKVSTQWKFTEKVILTDFIVPLTQGWGGEKIMTFPRPSE